MLAATLPLPPSANKIWRYIPRRPRPIKSTEYRRWISHCRDLLHTGPEPVDIERERCGRQPVRVEILAPVNFARDLDNLLKPLLDLLGDIGVVDNDSLVSLIEARRVPPDTEITGSLLGPTSVPRGMVRVGMAALADRPGPPLQPWPAPTCELCSKRPGEWPLRLPAPDHLSHPCRRCYERRRDQAADG